MKKALPLPLLLMGIGLLAFSFCLYLERINPHRLAFADVPVEKTTQSSSIKPVAIRIQDISVSLPLVASRVEKNNWEVTSAGVSYIAGSVVPGQKGNSVLYGHNFPSLLGSLYKVKPGEAIQILYADGTKKTFIVNTTIVVSPDQVDILRQSKDTRITLYTCTGWFDTKRFVVVAILAA